MCQSGLPPASVSVTAGGAEVEQQEIRGSSWETYWGKEQVHRYQMILPAVQTTRRVRCWFRSQDEIINKAKPAAPPGLSSWTL